MVNVRVARLQLFGTKRIRYVRDAQLEQWSTLPLQNVFAPTKSRTPTSTTYARPATESGMKLLCPAKPVLKTKLGIYQQKNVSAWGKTTLIIQVAA